MSSKGYEALQLETPHVIFLQFLSKNIFKLSNNNNNTVNSII